MIYLRSAVKKLRDDEGITFRKAQPVTYKSGYQVGIVGTETRDIDEACEIVRKYQNCGIWFSGGIYYIDKGRHVATKREALELGRKYNQQSVFCWASGKLAWC